jgi:hypothetical protein
MADGRNGGMLKSDYKTCFWRWTLRPMEVRRVVRIKSLVPRWDGGIAWPCLLVDRIGGGRETTTPIWDKARLLYWIGLGQ